MAYKYIMWPELKQVYHNLPSVIILKTTKNVIEIQLHLDVCIFPSLRYDHSALAGLTEWIEYGHANQRLASSFPSQGTCLGCRPYPQCGVC